MVQFNIVTSIAIVAFLLSSVTSRPVPVETSNIDDNDLRPRSFLSAIFEGTKLIAKVVGKAVSKAKAKAKAKASAKEAQEKLKYEKLVSHQHADYNGNSNNDSNNNKRDLSARSRGNMDKRDVLEERGWDHHNLEERGRLDELD